MIHFYFGSGSPFSWRVQMALEEKALPYEPHLLSFQAGDLRKPEYLAISPHGKVPAIVDEELRLYESQPILEYLDERYPAKALLPADPAVRAHVRVEEMECILYFMEAVRPLVRLAFFTAPDQRDDKALADARGEVCKQLAVLDGRCAQRRGDFVMGATFTRADVSWIPFVELAARAGAEVNAATVPWLAGWRTRMRARPSYERSYPPHWRK